MKAIVDVNTIRNNLKENIGSNLFNWIDIRNDFLHLGLQFLEDILRIENIGLVTDNIKDALKIRRINSRIPILLMGLDNIEQVYDLIMNNIILGINDNNLIMDINEFNLKDNLSIFVQIDIDNYEDGISIKNYKKIKESLKGNISLLGIYAIFNDNHNSFDNLLSLLEKEGLSSFAIGIKNKAFTDGFISSELLNNAIKYQVKVSKCIPLKKGDIFVNKKIKNDCFGIKIVHIYEDLSIYKKIMVDDEAYKIIKYYDNTLYLIGNSSLKNGKKIDITKYITHNLYINYPLLYNLNGKIIDYSEF